MDEGHRGFSSPVHDHCRTTHEVDKAFEDGKESTLDIAIRELEKAGERQAAALIRRTFDHWPSDHECVLLHGECIDCGRAL
jgi:hypothetical protein